MVDIADVQDLEVWGERYSRDSNDLESRLVPTEKNPIQIENFPS